MNTQETYEFIGKLAIALYSKEIRINLTSLNSILSESGSAYGSNRALGQGLSAAYNYWEKKDPLIHKAIAYTFTNKDGELSWNK